MNVSMGMKNVSMGLPGNSSTIIKRTLVLVMIVMNMVALQARAMNGVNQRKNVFDPGKKNAQKHLQHHLQHHLQQVRNQVLGQ